MLIQNKAGKVLKGYIQKLNTRIFASVQYYMFSNSSACIKSKSFTRVTEDFWLEFNLLYVFNIQLLQLCTTCTLWFDLVIRPILVCFGKFIIRMVTNEKQRKTELTNT